MDDAPKPKVPARRNKQQKVEVKREPKQQKPRPKRAELEQVASGPFAMGPAKAGKKTGNYTGSESTSTISSGVGRIGIHSKDPVIIDSNVLPTIESSSEDEQVVEKREEQLFLLQFPMNLPLDNQNELKSGKCGSWFKTKSGKVVVEIGNVQFEVQEHDSAIDQVVGFINDTKYVELGHANRKLVCTPHLQSLL